MDEHVRWAREQSLERAAKALRKHGMDAIWVGSAEEARDAVLGKIPAGATVGVGGSLTVRQLGLVAALEERGNVVHHHWKPGLSRDEDYEVRRAEASADVFLTSANAVTLEGELVNVDMTGNRVAAMMFGPRKAVVVAGVNKVVRDVTEGMWRARNVAGPPNARRLGAKVPCAELGYCADCDSPGRMCRVTTIIERRPARIEMSVVLVNEELGY